MLPGEREAAGREGSLYVSLPFRCNPRKNPNEPPPPQSRPPRPKTESGLQGAALEKNSERSAPRSTSKRRKAGKEGPEGLGRPLEGEPDSPTPSSGRLLSAVQTSGGSGAATSWVPAPRRHWPRRANTFRRSGRSSYRPRASACTRVRAPPSLAAGFPRKAQVAVGRDQRNSNSGVRR